MHIFHKEILKQTHPSQKNNKTMILKNVVITSRK
jgi:hypothetical protein